MTFGRKLEEPDPWSPLPTGYVSKPLDMSGWLVGRTLIPSDNIAHDVRVAGEMAWPSGRTRRNRASSDVTPSVAILEERIKALETQIKALEKQGE